MRIITPEEIGQVAWEGALKQSGQSFSKGVTAPPRVTMGEPVWWPAEQALESETGKKWTPPTGGQRYTLVRLSCTLHPPAEERTRYTDVTLTAYLRPHAAVGAAVAHDLYPLRETTETKGKFTVSLGPELKFAPSVDVKLGEIGAEIEFRRVFPVIQAFGLGESRPYWQFKHDATAPLLGSQSVYMVVAAAEQAGGVRLSVELVATVETRFGPIRVGLPEEARTHLSKLIS
jgi:hypothetical protein